MNLKHIQFMSMVEEVLIKFILLNLCYQQTGIIKLLKSIKIINQVIL